MEPLTGDDPVEVAGYRLRARLGAGGMGRVYLAFTPAGRPVALKVMRPDLGDDAEFRRRFRQEAEAARRVHGIYTAQVIDADPDAVPPWLVTAYVPGPSLHEAVTGYGPMPEQTVFVLLAGVAEALAAIHAAGIVHRDLKPSNVLLAPDGPRVIDFGIARAADGTALTRSGVRVGSPQFMAPEQVLGTPISPATDVFALGALGGFAALGRPPFGDGEEMTVLYRVVHSEADLTGCPPALRSMLTQCLAKDPASRPAPERIVALCRELSAGLTGAVEQSWLPLAVAESLVQHAAPPPSFPSHAAWRGPVDATQTATPAPPVTPPFPPAPGSGAAPTVPRPRRVSGALAIGGGLAAAGVAALLVAGLLVFSSHGGTPGGQHSSAPPSVPASVHTTATRPASLVKTTAPPPAVDPCVVGTWTNTATDVLNTIDGNPVQFNGSGGSETFEANGQYHGTWGPRTLTATVNGNQWAENITGSVTAHVNTTGGTMLFSDVQSSGGYTLDENGILAGSGPITIEPGPQRYVCTATTLRGFADNGSNVWAREK